MTGFYYMRLHGRNAAQWWRHDKSEDRYNYLYSAGELKEFAETELRMRWVGETESPLLGPAGNKEFLVLLQHPEG